jgi:hypothetical protein
MTISASVILSDRAQADGRRWIAERHTNGGGVNYLRSYLADADLDANAALVAYAITLETGLEAAEIASNIQDVATNGSLATPRLLFTTAAQNFAALRAVYQFATQVQAIMIGDYLSARTDAQLQTAFSMTAGQVTTLRTNKLTPAASAAATIRAAAGA